jgi:virulence-associated protein VapD
MFAIAFDLEMSALDQHYPRGRPLAYAEIRRVLEQRGFNGIQGSVYINDTDDMTHVFLAIQDLRALAWFSKCVRDIRAFRVELWSNFTDFVKMDSR